MSYNLVGLYVTAEYYGNTVTGKVKSSRMKHNVLVHYLTFDEPKQLGFLKHLRKGVMVEHNWVKKVINGDTQ